jgi:hypothetical protein
VSAILWTVVVAVALLVDAAWAAVVHFTHWPGLDLWGVWIQPALTFRQATATDLVPGIVVNALAVFIGFVAARRMLHRGGRVRVFHFGGLTFDLNTRVFSWFLQKPEEGEVSVPEADPLLFRVTMKSGTVFVGQIGQYSTDPNDDTQDIVLRKYSRVVGDNFEPVRGSHGALINRDAIEMIEVLLDPDELHRPAHPRRRRHGVI